MKGNKLRRRVRKMAREGSEHAIEMFDAYEEAELTGGGGEEALKAVADRKLKAIGEAARLFVRHFGARG